MKVLVVGGARSGKSRYAESLLIDRAAVRYVAPGPARDDADWTARVAAHQARRPATWTTLETADLADAIPGDDPVLIDSLGSWLTALCDLGELWQAPVGEVEDVVFARVADTVAALEHSGADVVVVGEEVGLSVVPEHRSARLFRDLLGETNQRVAAVCDEVHLVVAGRVLRL